VATGGSLLDPAIVAALVNPVTSSGALTADEEHLLQSIAEGRPLKAIAAARSTTPEAVDDAVERLFLKLAQQASTGARSSLRRLRMLHEAIVTREEQGETLSRLLPGGVAEKLRRDGRRVGETEMLDVTVLMSDIRGYSTIAEHAEPSVLAAQLNEHRAAMSRAVLAAGGTVMQFVGDAVMAVFGAPLAQDNHAQHAVTAAGHMHDAQAGVNERWAAGGLPPFGLGIGVSSGRVAAALLGSEERLEYSLVGDAVNLAQRLQQWAGAGETVVSQLTADAVGDATALQALEPAQVKGRDALVQAYRVVPAPPEPVMPAHFPPPSGSD
jgi:class 3 adenylate cyclase/DNA-binding CsgD family transcriptional regulator